MYICKVFSQETHHLIAHFPLELAPRNRKEHFIHPRSMRSIAQTSHRMYEAVQGPRGIW